MTGNGSGSGWTDPGIYAQPQTQLSTGGVPQPTSAQTNAAYGHYGLHHYHGNVQNLSQVNQTVSQQTQAKYGPLFGPIVNLLTGQGEVDSKLTSEAKSLKAGLDIRSAPPAANPVYENIPHQTLYDSVTKGVNPGSVGDVSSTWLQIGNGLTKLQSTVAQSIASSQVGWTGNSAELARQSIAKLGNQSGQAGQSAQLAGVLTAHQSEALSTAKNSVPPPPKNPFNPVAAQQQLQTITDPGAFAKQAAADHTQAAAQQAAHQEAAHVVQQYDQTVSQTSASMPAFAPAPPAVKPGAGGSTVITTPGSGSSGPSGSATAPRSTVAPGPTGHGLTNPGTGGSGSHAGTSPVSTSPSTGPTGTNGGGSQTTTTSGVGPTAPVTVGSPTSGLPGSGGPVGGGTDSFGDPFTGSLGGGNAGFGSFGAGGFGGGTGSGGVGGLGSEFGGGGSGAGGFGSASGASGSGAAGGDGTAGGSAARSGASSGAAAEEAAMSEEGTAGARGTSGSSGMGGMGAGRGQRGQGDSEHKRPDWLVESDEGIFAVDELTAPPVIGE